MEQDSFVLYGTLFAFTEIVPGGWSCTGEYGQYYNTESSCTAAGYSWTQGEASYQNKFRLYDGEENDNGPESTLCARILN